MFRFICHLLNKPYEPLEVQVLREQIKILQEQNQMLLETLVDRSKPEVKPVMEAPKPVLPRFTPWSVTQRSLEAKDREFARQQMKKQNPEIANEIDELEKELGVADASD